MADILTPTLGESVSEATIAKWSRKVGDPVRKDEVLVELETDKVSLEVVSPADGTLAEIKFAEGDTVTPGAILGSVTEGAASTVPAGSAPASAPRAEAVPAPASVNAGSAAFKAPAAEPALSPAVQRVVSENSLDPAAIAPTGPKGNITKGDALAAIGAAAAPSAPVAASAPAPAPVPAPRADHPREERVKMTRLRQTIARRLKESQNTAAQLTTFNEVDMTAVMALRNQYKDAFEKAHGVKLGFMSFFVKAATHALKKFPLLNASVDGNDIVYHGYFDIGIAVSSPRGLVVPILRDVDQMNLADIEKKIAEYGAKARDGKLSIEELTGGTFSISNGGVFGSMLSTPIINPPQSAILGIHATKERPVVEDGQIVIRPINYLALSYDHRIIDGREAVLGLVAMKEALEDPSRLLLDL
jgi:2-oxoglutarate dehydrogenase E2 component (dihydrolipoamide succinyltransferase)